MSEDLINRYKKSSRISFQNASSETKFRELQQRSGPDSSVLAFTVLFLLCLAYAYLEFRAFGHDIPIPMYGYLLAAGMALINLLVCRISEEHPYLQLRLISNGLLAMGTVIGAVFLQKYSAYHAIEFVLLVAWLGSLRPLSMFLTLAMNALLAAGFVGIMFVTRFTVCHWNSPYESFFFFIEILVFFALLFHDAGTQGFGDVRIRFPRAGHTRD